jgi:hypothetical protein
MSSSNGKDDIPYILESKTMFETTNQLKIINLEVVGGFNQPL